MNLKNEYREVFSQVTASPDTHRRIMKMYQKQNTGKRRVRLSRIAVIAAILCLLAVSVSAAGPVRNWLAEFFAEQSGEDLSGDQIAYIDENAQLPEEQQAQNGWSLELKTTISDGDRAILVLGVTAPEGTDLTPEIRDNAYIERFYLQNGDVEYQDVLFCDVPLLSVEENYTTSTGVRWVEDGDGLDNTKNVVMELTVVPLYPGKAYRNILNEAKWQLSFTSVMRSYEDTAYREELMRTKYKGQTDVMFTPEETLRLNVEEVLVEGNWHFDLDLSSNSASVELLSTPISTQASIWRKFGPGIGDYERVMDDVTVTSFRLSGLSAMVKYDSEDGVNFTDTKGRMVYAVLKDGTRIALEDQGSAGVGTTVLIAQTPIVLENVDYILMADGTVIGMPE